MVQSMTEPHKRANRHPKYKTAYRVKNWREYDQALRNRGDITLWISQDTIEAWTPPKTGKRGAQAVYSNIAIETALTLRLLFRLPLRRTEGFLHSILTLMAWFFPARITRHSRDVMPQWRSDGRSIVPPRDRSA